MDHSGERSVRNAEVVGSIPISSTRGRLAICKSAFLCCDIHHGLLTSALLLTLGSHRPKVLKRDVELNFKCIVPIDIDGLDRLIIGGGRGDARAVRGGRCALRAGTGRRLHFRGDIGIAASVTVPYAAALLWEF